MNDIKKEFEEIRKALHKLQFDYYEHGANMHTIVPDTDIKPILDLIEQKLSEAEKRGRIEELRKVFVDIYTKDEILKRISELEGEIK